MLVSIDETIMADFKAICKKFGYPLDEFELFEEDPITSEIAPLSGTVAVRRKINQEYSAGTPWLADFEDDLKKGVFGPL
jgi:hypothetical protein